MEKQFTTFYIDEMHCGIDILLVKEINRQLEIGEVAGAPDFIRGLLNLRGQIITVIDIGVRLGFAARQLTARSRCIVLKTTAELALLPHSAELEEETTGEMVGLFVDRIGDMITAYDKEIQAPPANFGNIDSRYLHGVIQRTSDLLVILRIGAALGAEKNIL
jgi:purine-binding chemotaxis protein CheW